MDTPQTKNIAFWNFIFSAIFAELTAASILVSHAESKLKFKIPFFDFIILGLAIFRITHLFVYDYITGYIRDFFKKYESGAGLTMANLFVLPLVYRHLGRSFRCFLLLFLSLCLVCILGLGFNRSRSVFGCYP